MSQGLPVRCGKRALWDLCIGSGKKQACCSTWTHWPILIVVMKCLIEQHVRELVAGAKICTGDGLGMEELGNRFHKITARVFILQL